VEKLVPLGFNKWYIDVYCVLAIAGGGKESKDYELQRQHECGVGSEEGKEEPSRRGYKNSKG